MYFDDTQVQAARQVREILLESSSQLTLEIKRGGLVT